MIYEKSLQSFSSLTTLRKVQITSRLGVVEGYTDGRIIYFDLEDQKSQRDVRHFILLDKSVKLMFEPFGWKDTWYVDLIQIEKVNDEEYKLTDFYLDILVLNNCERYKIVDFDDLANALVQGKVTPQELEIPLKGFQIFLDTNIYSKDFPPKEIEAYLERKE